MPHLDKIDPDFYLGLHTHIDQFSKYAWLYFH